jgi:outer membrane protein assembly factor BamB
MPEIRRGARVVGGAIALAWALAGAPLLAQWPEFRGPTGQGHAAGSNLPVEWNETRNVAWKVPVPGTGWSSPVVANGRVWLTSALPVPRGGASLRALAYDADTGKELVNVEVFRVAASRAPNPKNSLASPTPILADGHVYVHFGADGTAALTEAGEILWKTRLSYESQHGNGGSPAIVGNLLVINCDGFDDAYVIALDRTTGKRVWRTGRRQPFTQAYATPLVTRDGDRDQVLSVGAFRVTAYDATNGREVWRMNFADGTADIGFSNVARPVVGHGLAFISSGYGQTTLLAIRLGGTGDVTKTHVAWSTARGAPYTSSPLIVGDELYFVSDIGVATCADARTGQVHWQTRLGGNYSASPLFSDGRIYFQNEEGVTSVIQPGRTFVRVATNRIEDATLASMGVAGGAFFLRSQTALYKIVQRDPM